MEFVTVFQTLNPAEAQLVRSRLEAAGFSVNIAHEASAFSVEGTAPLAVGGIQIQVASDRSEDAKELLNSGESNSGAPPPAEAGT